MDVSVLNGWQRMRFCTLAVACRSSLADSRSTAGQRCDSCGVASAGGSSPDAFVHQFAAAHPGRALVDKHFDAIAQAMTELGVADWGAAAASEEGPLLLRVPAARGGSAENMIPGAGQLFNCSSMGSVISPCSVSFP